MNDFTDFADAIEWAENKLLTEGVDVNSGRWQGYETKGKPDLMTKEILNLQFGCEMPFDQTVLQNECQPNLPWADMQFEERVGREPQNPDRSLEHWPWWHGQKSTSMTSGEIFTHTYSERFWPARAIRGIRYHSGNLDDVVRLMVKEPYGRQAYLPIFFPEDTGAHHGGRTPCSLGYHFLLRRNERSYNRLHCWYDIRSCDLVRHFRDDIYLAVRLVQHVLAECQYGEHLMNLYHNTGDVQLEDWKYTEPGTLYFCAHSFHVHYGDLHHVQG